MKAVVFSLGCKVNQCEGQSIIAEFESAGVAATDKLEYADIYVLNTCSVTAEADRKSRQTVSRALRLNPAAKVYICGCSAQNDPTAFAGKQNVRIISGVSKKGELVEGILGDFSQEAHKPEIRVCALPSEYEESVLPRHTKTRSYIKIQDGCNNFCSYCIIPHLRGRSRSRSIESIVKEAEIAAKQTKEIVFTGIDVSSYGKDTGTTLCSLADALASLSVRKRLSSLECTAISDELLEALAKGGFCDHFHLSLQSGSESVLRRMNRKYTPEFYLKQVEKIRKVFPHAGITTDVITGFGGETEEEFAETVAFVKAVRFSDMHVFPYSERKGTRACALPQIDKSVRQARANELIKVGEQMRSEFYTSELGNLCEVYAETKEDGMSVGYTSNYIKVYSDLALGEMSKVRLEKLYKEGVKGTHYE